MKMVEERENFVGFVEKWGCEKVKRCAGDLTNCCGFFFRNHPAALLLMFCSAARPLHRCW